MKRLLILFLLALSVSANAQINKKLIHFMLAGSGGAWSSDLNVNNNTSTVITFTGVTVSSGKILIEIRATAGAGSFAYINGLTLDSE